MALPSINDLKMWVGTLFTKDDWDFNFSQIVGWLANGESDIVVNSVKATNGIDLDGAQISNVGVAETGSQAVNLDQALTLLNRTSYYYPFSVASGKIDSNGDSAFIQKDSDTQVTVLAGNVNPDLVCIQSDGTVESVTSNTVLTVPVTNGTYYIVKEKEQSITLTTGSANKVTVGKKFPSTQNTGDYFLDNSTVPFVGYKYGASGWEETPFCYLGYVTVSSGVAKVTTINYNDNKFDVILSERYHSGDSGYRVYSDGFKVQWGAKSFTGGTHSYTITFLKPFAGAHYTVALSWTATANVGDKQFNYACTSRNTSTMTLQVETEGSNSQSGTLYWVVMGY